MTTLRIDGMKCQHCAQTAKKILEDLGATAVSIDLAKGQANYEGVLEKETVRKLMREQGYTLID
ncbi:heavy-metal-associated domain-containing protein [Desulfobulbus propionicus]|jgi:copper chaperone CopZ